MQALNEVGNPSFCCSSTSQNVTFASGMEQESHGGKNDTIQLISNLRISTVCITMKYNKVYRVKYPANYKC
jgi:hypothetical protein